MKKINRRDYLISMGAGAAGVVGATALDVVGQKKRSSGGSTRPAAVAPLKWPVTNTPPSRDSFVTAVIWGLAGIWYKGPGSPSFEVGFHPGHPQHPHGLKIRIFKNPGCVDITPDLLPTTINRIRLTADTTSTPTVFETNEAPFDRTRPEPTPDPDRDKDFRWMPDLHGPPFYPETSGTNAYPGPRLSISKGTLYTRVKTNSTFCLVDVRRPNTCLENFGRIALYMAAAIEGTSASLLINEVFPIPLPKVPTDVKYQIVFRNECDGIACQAHDQTSPDETRWNDFHHNRNIIRVPFGGIKYGLKTNIRAERAALPDFCYGDLEKFDKTKTANDEAPCSATGFGRM